jgi:CRP-like cAMP-binding protein
MSSFYVSSYSWLSQLSIVICRYGKPRAATVIALTEGRLWALDRRVFRSVVMKSTNAQVCAENYKV